MTKKYVIVSKVVSFFFFVSSNPKNSSYLYRTHRSPIQRWIKWVSKMGKMPSFTITISALQIILSLGVFSSDKMIHFESSLYYHSGR
ncbi:hypothetical protein, partial [Salmonella enterica]|uniref:hypothetical protein n=1 Tax=Salmonella enterica TaxID=28901 RepID=UPI001F47C8F3